MKKIGIIDCSCIHGGLDDYRPVLLTHPIIDKCFQRVMTHIPSGLPDPLDLPAICVPAQQVHLRHLHCCTPLLPLSPGNKNSYARMLFVDYSSTFSTVISHKLLTRGLCYCLLDFQPITLQSVSYSLKH